MGQHVSTSKEILLAPAMLVLLEDSVRKVMWLSSPDGVTQRRNNAFRYYLEVVFTFRYREMHFLMEMEEHG